MNDITLATLIEQRFRAEKLDDNDAYKYLKNDWLIDAIINLLEQHPKLKEKIQINEMSISKIISIIEAHFKNLQKVRTLNRKKLISFITNNAQFRKSETLILLLILGFSFSHSFKRMNNNNKEVDEVLEIEPSATGVTCNVNYKILMPKQSINKKVKELYDLISNTIVPAGVIERYFQELQKSLENRTDKINVKLLKKDLRKK